MLEGLFWIAVGLIIYSYFIFPLLIFLFAAIKQASDDAGYMFHKKERRVDKAKTDYRVAVVLSAYNEEKVIRERALNLLSQELEVASYTILIGSDGSADNTVEQLADINDPRLIVYDNKENRGKVNVLNELLEKCDADIVVFTDANTEFMPDNINNLLKGFQDPNVGAVCGELKLYSPDQSDNKDGAYWNYERFIKFFESKLGCILGANGANYAIRRELFQPFASDVIIDDFENVMNIAKSGHKVIYAKNANALEEIPANKSEEYNRRVRIGNGNYQYFFRNLDLLNPLKGMLWFAYFSHKVLRWFTPHFMVAAFVLNLLLVTSPLYAFLLIGQVLVYANSVLFRSEKYRAKMPGLLGTLDMFVYMNYALLMGFKRYLSGGSQSAWGRTER